MDIIGEAVEIDKPRHNSSEPEDQVFDWKGNEFINSFGDRAGRAGSPEAFLT